MESYSAIRKTEINLSAAKWMDLRTVILNEVNQQKYISYATAYMWNLQKYINCFYNDGLYSIGYWEK